MRECLRFCDAQRYFLTLFSVVLALFCVWEVNLKTWNFQGFLWYFLGVKMRLTKNLQVSLRFVMKISDGHPTTFILKPLPLRRRISYAIRCDVMKSKALAHLITSRGHLSS